MLGSDVHAILTTAAARRWLRGLGGVASSWSVGAASRRSGTLYERHRSCPARENPFSSTASSSTPNFERAQYQFELRRSETG